MRFLTCADSDADTAVGCGGDDGDEDDEELNGLRPPKDILGLDFGTRSGMVAFWKDRRSGLPEEFERLGTSLAAVGEMNLQRIPERMRLKFV
jgi:hypothetical protein